jgi:uncharacterized protein (TIGR02246 family)
MNEEEEKQKIRDVISGWMAASADGDTERVLSLMAEDVIFLMPGRPPMRREAFAAGSNASKGQVRFEGTPDIQEIHISGNFAFCWTQLSLKIIPLQGGTPMNRAGPILTVFRKGPDGRWLLFRDANMLTPT